MGNFCCTDEINKGLKCEEYRFDIEKTVLATKKNPNLLHSRLDTVKEEPNEFTEQSEYRSVSRASKNNG